MSDDEMDVAMKILEPSEDGRMGKNPGVKDLLLGAADAMTGGAGRDTEVYKFTGDDAERYVSEYLDQFEVAVYEQTGEQKMPDGTVIPDYDPAQGAVTTFNTGKGDVTVRDSSNVYVTPETSVGDEVQGGTYAVQVTTTEDPDIGDYEGPGKRGASIDVGEDGVSGVVKEFISRNVSGAKVYDKAVGDGVGDNDMGSDLRPIYERLAADR